VRLLAAALCAIPAPLLAQSSQGAPPSLWVPVAGAAFAFLLKLASDHWARISARWNVAWAVEREAIDAARVLPDLAEQLTSSGITLLGRGQRLFLFDDFSEGSVFRIFAPDLKLLPRYASEPALRYFESYAFVSAMLRKIEAKDFLELPPERRFRVVGTIADSAREAAAEAMAARRAMRRYLRGRFVPAPINPKAAERIAVAMRRKTRRARARIGAVAGRPA
jgi:hypothetical protein